MAYADVGASNFDPAPPPDRQLLQHALWYAGRKLLLLALGIAAVAWLVVRLRHALLLLLLALIVTAGITPVAARLSQPRRVGIGSARWAPPRVVAVLVVYFLLILVVVFVGALALPPLGSEAEALLARAPGYAQGLDQWIAGLHDRFPLVPRVDVSAQLSQQIAEQAGKMSFILSQVLNLVQFAGILLSSVIDFLFVLVMAIWLTLSGETIRTYLVGFVPVRRRPLAAALSARIGDRFGGWLRGQLALSGIIGLLTLPGLLLIGVPYAVLLALVAAVGEAIPYLGPIFSAVPALLLAVTVSPYTALLTLGLYILIQQLENHLIVPKVMGKAVAIHPVAVIIAIAFGGDLAGVWGAVLAVPVAAALAVIVSEVRRELRDGDPDQSVPPPGHRLDGAPLSPGREDRVVQATHAGP